jgi:UDP-N-acetylglucosamine 2-epimerase (non-hydrolysing)
VHTGQHYDANMSEVFFKQLEMPAPDVNLEVGSGSHARQTADIMTRFEPVVHERKPDVVLVYGDVNSTVAAALVCSKLSTRVGHVEAGLRSFDRGMPEEINRLLTDQLSDLLFTPSEDADQNLAKEGIPADKIYRVGNVMIDSLVRLLPATDRLPTNGYSERYALVTLHRPSNVDDAASLKRIVQSLLELTDFLEVCLPCSPKNSYAPERVRRRPFSASYHRTASLYRVPGAPASRVHGDHGLRRHSGRDDLPPSALHYDSREHRASDYCQHGKQYVGRPRHGRDEE